MALGACIGLAISLVQIMLREATLRVEAGFRPGRQLLLSKPETVIGRAESCDLGLFGDAGVEKVHAKITRQGNNWMLSDAGTPSGTMLNGQPLTQKTALKSGDRIMAGHLILICDGMSSRGTTSPVVVFDAPRFMIFSFTD